MLAIASICGGGEGEGGDGDVAWSLVMEITGKILIMLRRRDLKIERL